MINDKSLERAMRTSSKTGVTIYAAGGGVHILGHGWMAETSMRNMRDHLRGSLGTIVEMAGYIPEDEAVTIYKASGEWQVQPELPEVTGDNIGHYAGETVEYLNYTGIRYKGYPLYQATDLKVYGASDTAPRCDGELKLNEKGIIEACDNDADEAVYREAFRREDKQWSCFEQIAWRDENEADEAD